MITFAQTFFVQLGYSTNGIIIHKINYSESSQIFSILTENHGFQKYFIQSIKRAKNKKQYSFHHLSIVEISGKMIKEDGIQNLSSIKPIAPLLNIVSSFERISIAFFISEIMTKVLTPGLHSEGLYSFLYQKIQQLDQLQTNLKFFPHEFLISLSEHLGFGLFYLQKEISPVDAIEFNFPIHEFPTLKAFLGTKFVNESVDRSTLLDELLKFYDKQIDTFGALKSLEVIRQVMNS
ncbi:MAG: DNA repair protein RecO [Flavobacteriales bacterium]|nr:DNA repair protein RecO [Flavobacteriales bacterium]